MPKSSDDDDDDERAPTPPPDRKKQTNNKKDESSKKQVQRSRSSPAKGERQARSTASTEAPAAHQRNTSSNRGDAAGNRLTQSNVGSTRAQLIAAQRSKFERKKMRDIKIQEQYFNALRPDTARPAFITKFDTDENTKSKTPQHTNRAYAGKKDWKEERRRKEEAVNAKKEQEKAWLDGLRPSLRDKQDWNLDTHIDRPPTPEKIFRSDDEFDD